jgi:hypothetical protein
MSAKAIAPKPRDNITYRKDNTQSRSATRLGIESPGAHCRGGHNSVRVFAGLSVSRCVPQGRRRGFLKELTPGRVGVPGGEGLGGTTGGQKYQRMSWKVSDMPTGAIV